MCVEDSEPPVTGADGPVLPDVPAARGLGTWAPRMPTATPPVSSAPCRPPESPSAVSWPGSPDGPGDEELSPGCSPPLTSQGCRCLLSARVQCVSVGGQCPTAASPQAGALHPQTSRGTLWAAKNWKKSVESEGLPLQPQPVPPEPGVRDSHSHPLCTALHSAPVPSTGGPRGLFCGLSGSPVSKALEDSSRPPQPRVSRAAGPLPSAVLCPVFYYSGGHPRLLGGGWTAMDALRSPNRGRGPGRVVLLRGALSCALPGLRVFASVEPKTREQPLRARPLTPDDGLTPGASLRARLGS